MLYSNDSPFNDQLEIPMKKQVLLFMVFLAVLLAFQIYNHTWLT